MMKMILAGIALVVVSIAGVGCAGQVDSSDSNGVDSSSVEQVGEGQAALTSQQLCILDCDDTYLACVAADPHTSACKTNKHDCVLGCKNVH